jgi:hypothetical protein
MADLQRLEEALVNADKAGDTAAATALAQEIRTAREGENGGDNWGGRIATQLTKGATAFLGTPRMATDLMQSGANYLADQVGVTMPQGVFKGTLPLGTLPTADEMNKGIFGSLGVEEVNAKTDEGKILDTAIQAVPGGIALGGVGGMLPAFVGGAGSEIAGQIAEAGDLPPWVQTGARIVGGAAAGTGANVLQALGKGFAQGATNLRGRNTAPATERIAARSFRRDQLDPQRLGQALDDLGPGSTLADVGGGNVRSTVRAAIGQLGQARQIADDVLVPRKVDEGARVGQAINKQVSANQGFTSTIDDIVAQRSAKAGPLYEAAGIPKDPKLNAQAPRLVSPEIADLLKNSKDIQAAIREAKRLPQYKDLPDDSIVLLDKAYKYVGDRADEAVQAGKGARSRDLIDLRENLKAAIAKEKPEYEQALKVFSSESRFKDAIEQGRKLFAQNADTEVVAKAYKALDPDEQLLFRQGVAEHLRKVAGGSTKGSPAERVFGGPISQDRLREVLGRDYDDFAKAMNRESVFNRTYNDVRVGSRTTPMANEMDDLNGQIGNVGEAVRGNWLQAIMGAGGKLYGRATEGRTEAVNAELVKMLMNPDRTANAQAIAKVTERMKADELARLLRQRQWLGSSVAIPATVGGQN